MLTKLFMNNTRQALKDISKILHEAGWDAEPAPPPEVNVDDLKNFQVVVRMSGTPQIEIVAEPEPSRPAEGRLISNNLETARNVLAWLQRKIDERHTSLTP